MTIRRTEPERRTSREWEQYLYELPDSEKILTDLSGWDQKNLMYSFYEELVTLEEFSERQVNSNVINK